ncbi:MAG: DEAD/DEAH box helicase [Spirochaetes bacterium]|jgi:ATP-dependent Lhr-like helicase|nr:DEAD/DEAH box helicase [Spirochaetota bacterium]
MSNILDKFHPLIREWFSSSYERPTEIQSLAWDKISQGRHLLVTAPTGSGKTLTAFLWGINELLLQNWESGAIRILYISPLKALNNDIRKNLTGPIEELRQIASKKKIPFTEIKVAVRSGDTTPEERRAIGKRPPEIFITTPESLNIILSSPRGRSILTGIRLFIADEIHSIAGSKRGVHLMSGVERLTKLSGEFQRLALSATVTPLEKVAGFIGGYKCSLVAGEAEYTARPVDIVSAKKKKEIRCTVIAPDYDIQNDDDWLSAVVDRSVEIINQYRTTLLFANSRRMVEKIARHINERVGEEVAFSHHGSLSREIRSIVEERLKNGELKALVATGSLELGIDVGDVGFVILVQTPWGVNAAIQRIGRSNHSVDGVSEGVFLPVHGRDFLEAAVTAYSTRRHYVEPLSIPLNPLDILAQLILSLCAVDEWRERELYDFIRTIYNYNSLPKHLFDLVIEMLCGRYAGSRIKELSPKLFYDRVDGTIKSRDGVRYHLYSSGGTIPDRGEYNLKLQSNGSKIGTLDEEFVWERNVGDTFALGVQCWVVKNITHNDIEVMPAKGRPGIIPFWRAEQGSRHFTLSERLLHFLEMCEGMLDEKADSLQNILAEEYCMSHSAAETLICFLATQRAETGVALPHAHHVVIEHCSDPENSTDNKQVIIHTMWGRSINQPIAMALSAYWKSNYGYSLEVFVNNDSVLLQLPHSCRGRELFDILTGNDLESLIRDHLETSGFFGSLFRENAARSLLLPPKGFRVRQPLWMNRLRSRKLFEAVHNYPDFPVTLETWRTALCDIFDMENLRMLLDRIEDGTISISNCVTRKPSSFCDDLVWNQINKYMYQDDTPHGGVKSSLSDSLIRDITSGFLSRVAVDEEVVSLLDGRLKRTAAGYAGFNEDDFIGWVDERIVIPENEWDDLIEAWRRDSGADCLINSRKILENVVIFNFSGKTVYAHIHNYSLLNILFPGAVCPARPLDCAYEETVQKRIAKTAARSEALPDTNSIIKQFVSYYALFRVENLVGELFGEPGVAAIATLIQDGSVITDRLYSSLSDYYQTTKENYEILLRMQRRNRRAGVSPLPVERLQPFLARYQGLRRGTTVDDLKQVIEQLSGYPLEAALWEESIFPSRITDYTPLWLDSLISSTDLLCCGAGTGKFTFIFQEESRLFNKGVHGDAFSALSEGRPFTLNDFAAVKNLSSADASQLLFQYFFKASVSVSEFDIIRKGILRKFKDQSSTVAPVSYNRWKSNRGVNSVWRALGCEPVESRFEEFELQKDRVRQLFNRYPLIFRQLLNREEAPFRWKALFPALRLMELSGEIVSGYFFEDIPSLQFISQEGLRFFMEYSQLSDDEGVFWMNAKDPVSLAGVDIEFYKKNLPHRKVSQFIVYEGQKPVMFCANNFRRVSFMIPPESVSKEHLSLFRDILGRRFNPPASIRVCEVNGFVAHKSEYRDALIDAGFRPDFRSLILERK